MTTTVSATGPAVAGLDEGVLAAPPNGSATISTAAILTAMLDSGSGISDLFFSPGRPPQVEKQGILMPVAIPELPVLRPDDTSRIARDLVGQNAVALRTLKEEGSCDLSYSLPERTRFRVNIFRQRGTFAIVMRVIASKIPTLADLKLPLALADAAALKNGIVLVTGPTGSGKSSTLAAIIDLINETRAEHILTIEDPIEFLHRDIKSSINQREVGTDTNSFAQALRRVLRQDPDVLLVGEIRDLETLDIALKAAETGHLVFSTLHTTDATQTINRILSFYPPHQQAEVRYMLSTALRAIISLRLVRRADKKGRVPAAEILINTEAVRDQMRDMSKSMSIPQLIKEGAVPYGMQSFDQSLMNWYQKGVITYDDALFAATNPAEFALRAQGISASSDTSWDTVKQEAV
jgi:twitching motility protein PilT